MRRDWSKYRNQDWWWNRSSSKPDSCLRYMKHEQKYGRWKNEAISAYFPDAPLPLP